MKLEGGMKRGQGLCGTFKVINLTYHAHTTFRDMRLVHAHTYGLLEAARSTCTYL